MSMTIPLGTAAPLESLDGDDRMLLRALYRGEMGRAELAQWTGWSRNTVASKLEKLLASGWALETSEAPTGRGRPSTSYRLNTLASLNFVARFNAERVGAAICSLDGSVLAWEARELPNEPGPEGAVQTLDEMLETMTGKHGIDRSLIRAMVVGVPGPVSDMRRTVPWSKVGVLPSDFATHFGMRVAVDNDANIMALGVQTENPEADSVLFLLVETGIGAGLVFSGRLHRGLAGWAGEVGHIPVSAAGDTPCVCGNRGCLAKVASNPALMRSISTEARPVTSVDDLRELVLSGDTDAIVALREAGRHIGEAITGLVVGLAPSLISVGGDVAQIGDHILAGIRESLAQRTPPAISAQLRITATRDHNLAGVKGAATLAFDLLLPRDGNGAIIA